MGRRGLGGPGVLALAALLAGCSGGSAPPPFSDVQLRHLRGQLVQEHADFYDIERAADIAALLATPDEWSPPADLPSRTVDGALAHTKGELVYDEQGRMTSERVMLPGAGPQALHGDAQRVFTAQKPGISAIRCILTMIDRAGARRSSCGDGERRFVPPDTLKLEVSSDSSVDNEEVKFDPQGRIVGWDRTSRSKNVPAGGHPYDRSRHLIAQAYDAAGRATASHGTENGEQRYNYTLFFDPDTHGNPQRVVDVSSTSADRHDLQAIKRVQLQLMTYTYHNEVR